MTKRPTLKTVAEAAQVSLPTVSQVMRGVGRISHDTREKVLTTARKLNYIPDEHAVSMRSGRATEVGMIVHHLANPFNAELISGATDTLEDAGYLLSVLDARDDAERLERHMQLLLGKTRGGILWVPAKNTSSSLLKMIEDQKVPSVTFLRDGGSKTCTNISIDNFDALVCATQHLIQLGHTNIAYVGGNSWAQTHIARVDGYRHALKQAGIHKELILDTKDIKPSGFEIIQTIRQKYPHITALLCNGDEIAIGVCLGLQRMGQTAGKEISVIGFDDIAEAALMTPALTTIAVQPYVFGQRLAQVLLNKIKGENAGNLREIVPTRLIIRDTTRAPFVFSSSQK